MKIGYDLVKEQLFFRQELKERVFWFIHLRWIGAGSAITISWVAYLLGQDLPILPVNVILLFIIFYNTIFLYIGKRLETFRPGEVRPFTIFAHTQISLDLLSLYLLIYFTGGIYSPLLIFFIFHIILAGILLPPLSCFLYGVLVIVAMGGLIASGGSGLLPPQPILFRGSVLPYRYGFADIFVPYLTFAVAILISTFLITSVKVSLRVKARSLLDVSHQLDLSNTKLTALYEMVKEMDSHYDLKELMDSATRYATKIMGVKGCSIKLLNDDKRTLRFVSVYGLSRDYRSKESIDLEKSPINLRIIEGSPYTIGDIDEKDYFQYPEDIRREGIASMLCLPLRAEEDSTGVFCVYSEKTYRFGEEDIKFFSLMTDLTALAIANVQSSLARSWFTRKAVHQIRSPLNAIRSMLKTVTGGYVGGLTDEQRQLLTRTDRRAELLGNLINDILKFDQDIKAIKRTKFLGLNPSKILKQVVELYQAQAIEKGIEFKVAIEETGNIMIGNQELLDEIFTNLISNAVKYTPQNGIISINLSMKGGDQVLFEISDTGIGISEEDIPRLFGEFFRAENAKAIDESGTGLGLVIVKEVIDRLGGSIEVKSTVGEGTHFTCILPLAPPEFLPHRMRT
ncbi:MAG: GAF domain-containing sensor histidine kinase [Pseudomonadota bacterium]